MRLLDRLRAIPGAVAAAWRGEARALSMKQLRALATGYASDAKIKITEANAMQFAAFWASVRTISETKASLPVHVFEVNADGTEVRTALHPVAQLFSVEPNADMTPMICGETRQGHLLTWGNTYSEIEFDPITGEPVAYWPFHPNDVAVDRDDEGSLIYIDKSEPGYPRELDRSRVLHVPGFGGDGIVGWAQLKLFAHSIGLGLAEDRFASGFFGDAQGKPAVVVGVDGQPLTPEQQGELKDQVLTQWRGAGSDGVLVFGRKVTTSVLSMPLVDAQLLEMRKFQGEEIACRCFNLPPAIAGYFDANLSLDDQDRYLEKHTLRPWLVRDEQEMNRKLFARVERGRFRVKHIVDGLLRGDIKTRYEAYRLSLMIGFRTVNEVRKLEDLPPVEGGDILARPASVYGTTLAELPGGAKGGDQGNAANAQGDPAERSVADPRLVQLTEQHLRGLFRRVAVAAGRAAADPATFEDRTAQFFERHLPLVSERLAALGSADQVLQATIAQREQLRSIQAETDLPAAVERLAEQWDADASRVAQQLLTSH